MKNTKSLGLIAIVAVITLAFTALSLTGCEQPTSPEVKELSGAISISPDSNVTVNTELTATYSGSETVSFQWKKDGVNVGTASTTNPNKFTPDEAGTYRVTVSAAGYAPKTSDAVEVTVTGAAALTLGGEVTITPNTDVNIGTELTANYSGSEDVSYQWKRDGENVGENSNKYTPTAAGSHTVTVSAAGYNSKTSAGVEVNDPNLPILSGDITITPNENVITGMELTANYNGSEDVSYQWKRDGENVGTNSNKYTATAAGSYTVTVSATGYNSKISNAVTVSALIPIVNAEIEITAPVKSDAPDTTATTEEENFTVGAATWSPADNPFKGGVAYTVTVTLTAKSGYTFAGLTHPTVNGGAATASNNTGAAVTLSYTFPATDTRTATVLDITSPPTKLEYTHGETLNLDGLVVKLTFDDGTSDTVAAANFAAHNITASPSHGDHLVHSTRNGHPVVISYGSHLSQNTGNLTVNQKAIDAITVDAIPEQHYNGSAHTPTVTVKDGETTLTLTTDYTVAYANNTNAGTASVTITGEGNYSGSRTETFTINPKAITASGITVDPIPAQTYIGSALTPTVTVKDGETTLAITTDYTVSYSNNTSGGTAIVTITGEGNYSGTRTVNFTINTPIPLTVNQWTDGSLPTVGDAQWFSFTATAATQYIHFSPGGLTVASVQLYTSSGVASGNNTQLSGSSSSTSRTGLTAEQTYYIRVMSSSGSGGSYRIGFTATFVAPPGAATPLIENEWADGSIPTGGGQEWFSFTATASEQFIHFDFGTLTNLYVQLYTSSGATSGSETQLSSSTTSTSSTSRTGLTPGATYYIRVRGFYATNSGTYRIAFNTSFIRPGVTPITLTENQWTDGSLPTSSDVQWFTFTATADTQYIHLEPGSLSVYVQLYTSSGIAVENEPLLQSLPPGTSRSLTNGQTYYIRVRPTYGGSGAYRITFNTSFLPPGTTPISLTENQWADGSLPTSNDVQWFTFTATADTQYIHFSPGAMTNVNVRVYDSSGAAVGSETNLWTVTRNTSRTLESGQTYYIRARPSGGTGTYWIGFTTSTTAPNRVQIPSNAIQLTENIWADGSIPTSSDVQWFVFTATADTQYLHYSPGLSGGVYVQVYNSSGAAVGSETNLDYSTRNTSRTLESGQTYYIRVRPFSSTGTYRIGFTTSTTAPAS